MKITPQQIGNEVGFALPAEIVERLGAHAGDALKPTENPNGFTLEASDDLCERQTEAAQKPIERYRISLRKLED